MPDQSTTESTTNTCAQLAEASAVERACQKFCPGGRAVMVLYYDDSKEWEIRVDDGTGSGGFDFKFGKTLEDAALFALEISREPTS